eukprot:1585264-Amphidinium_carterae.1
MQCNTEVGENPQRIPEYNQDVPVAPKHEQTKWLRVTDRVQKARRCQALSESETQLQEKKLGIAGRTPPPSS